MINIFKSASRTERNYIPITYSLSGSEPWFAIFSVSGGRTKSSFMQDCGLVVNFTNGKLYNQFNITIYIKTKKGFMFWHGYMDGILVNIRRTNKKSFSSTQL
jgi:hypothetical protein